MPAFPRCVACASVAWLLVAGSVRAVAAPVVIDDFATGRGHFNSPIDAGDHTTGFFVPTSSVTHDPSVGHNAPGSLKLVIDDDPAVNFRIDDPWRLQLLSGAGIPADNLSLASTGYIGYWLKTTAGDVNASIIVNDGAGMEQGHSRPVTPDGQWHLYEWNLESRQVSEAWNNYSGGNGVIDSPTVTINALQLWTAAVPREVDGTFWIDDVSHNPSGSLVPEPASLFVMALMGLLMARRRPGYASRQQRNRQRGGERQR